MFGPSTAFTCPIKLLGPGNPDRQFVKPAGRHRIPRSSVDALVILAALVIVAALVNSHSLARTPASLLRLGRSPLKNSPLGISCRTVS